jgi:hypothetical protein
MLVRASSPLDILTVNASVITEVITSARVNDDAEWVSGEHLRIALS